MTAAVAFIPLEQRLTLDHVGGNRWGSRHGDSNQNGRSFGGQLLGQAMRAALLEAPAGRQPTMMQFVFLQGAMPDRPIDFDVAPLQQGKRFTSLRVRGAQGERTVLDAQVSCALPLSGPSHETPTPVPVGERPSDLQRLDEVSAELTDRLALMGGYGRDFNPSVDFRIPDAARQLAGSTAGPRFRYWMRVAEALPADPRLHVAAFAYLSDWWLNFCILGPHVRHAGDRTMYISSLNHALWLHRAPHADQWVHVEATSVHAAQGHGLAVAKYHDQEGRHIATTTQDCLVAYTD